MFTKETEMSVLSHNLSPTKWWQCSHPLVCLLDCFGFLVSTVALFFVESLLGIIFISIVVLQFAASTIYHWRYEQKFFQSIDLIMITLLIVGTVFPYVSLQTYETIALWILLHGVVIVVYFTYRSECPATILVGLTQFSFGCISVWFMFGALSDFGQTVKIIFWVGVVLYAIQMLVFYVGRLKFEPIVREIQHGLLLLPTTQIHVWLVVYLF
jgi:predicted membrane channel-forming protein YqfA (hemolysin III family)